LVYAAPVPVSLIKEFAAVGIEVRQLYGLTECTGPATVIDGENAIKKAGSCGPPFFHNEIRVVDMAGNDAGPDEMGEVLVSGTNLMKGYWNRPDATAETIKDGWLYTGDMARMDADGFLYIMDRKKDMIISDGENIYPAEIEDLLLRHLKIADVGVIGSPDGKWGEVVKAIVVLKDGENMTADELIGWCHDKIARFKIPKKIDFTNQIPRTPTGKILKRILREQFNQ
ncbi:AMP-binding protein, partial [bacterium]|nr:AMP-binding protein [bacterium]